MQFRRVGDHSVEASCGLRNQVGWDLWLHGRPVSELRQESAFVAEPAPPGIDLVAEFEGNLSSFGVGISLAGKARHHAGDPGEGANHESAGDQHNHGLESHWAPEDSAEQGNAHGATSRETCIPMNMFEEAWPCSMATVRQAIS